MPHFNLERELCDSNALERRWLEKNEGKLGEVLESLRLPNNEIVTSNNQTVGNLRVEGFFMLRLLMHPALHLRFFV